MWELYVFEDKDMERRKYDAFTSILDAFRKGNELMKAKACRRYRVEKEGVTTDEVNEA